MTVTAHVEQLKQRHQMLETELANLTSSPSSSDAELAEIKRRKLKLKDEIARLNATG